MCSWSPRRLHLCNRRSALLSGCKPQAHFSHPLGDRQRARARPALAHTVHDSIVGIALAMDSPDSSGIHASIEREKCMKRFARSATLPTLAEVPLSRSTSVPSGHCSGAASHRFTYSSAQAVSRQLLDRFDDEVPGHRVEELLDIEIDDPVLLQHRCRHTPTASRAACSAGRHRSRSGTVVPPFSKCMATTVCGT